jgi:hypothetical protein
MDIPDALVPVKTTADAAIQTKYLKMSPDISFKPPLTTRIATFLYLTSG